MTDAMSRRIRRTIALWAEEMSPKDRESIAYIAQVGR